MRGSRQGESHGGVYLVHLDREQIEQTIDWNTTEIDWQGRGWDRGLRGIEFDGDRVFIAASDELFVYDRDFKRLASYRSPYLKHCHEISRFRRRLFLTSTGFDALLGFDLDANRFSWGLHVSAAGQEFAAAVFDPEGEDGPPPGNRLHLNSVCAQEQGLYLAGLRTQALLKFDGRRLRRVTTLPTGVHNARPFRGGVLFNDSEADVVRFEAPSVRQVFHVPRYAPELLTGTDLDDTRIARQAFGRGLACVSDTLIAAGSSPSTISLHDLEQGETTLTITLSHDIRNAIHGLEVWPYSA